MSSEGVVAVVVSSSSCVVSDVSSLAVVVPLEGVGVDVVFSSSCVVLDVSSSGVVV